jgi:hypothetical protein
VLEIYNNKNKLNLKNFYPHCLWPMNFFSLLSLGCIYNSPHSILQIESVKFKLEHRYTPFHKVIWFQNWIQFRYLINDYSRNFEMFCLLIINYLLFNRHILHPYWSLNLIQFYYNQLLFLRFIHFNCELFYCHNRL